MNILIFGASGMVGQGVLRQCLATPDVRLITTIGRSSSGPANPKLREIGLPDLSDFDGVEPLLTGFDACFFCLGVSSSGMAQSDYERITYTLTLDAAQALSRLNPGMVFIYVSGAGTDSSEKGRVMWARVKGRTENALLRLPLNAFMFRPGIIEPLDGIKSKTAAYRIFYNIAGPILPLIRRFFPNAVLTTREIGQAMLSVSRRGYPSRILEARDIRATLVP